VYGIRKIFDDASDDRADALDQVADADARFGSYEKLARASEFRFRHPDKER
jgi:hypothetical protein